MDLSFTKNPEWIEQRERQWKEIEGPYRDGSSRKEVALVKHYFMTGEKPDKILDVGTILRLFPVFTVEGIQYCLNNYVSSSVSDEQYKRIQHLLANQDSVVGVTFQEKKTIFEFTFGELYSKHRGFPFSIAGDTVLREISVSSNYLFSLGTGVYSFIKRNEHYYTKHWLYLHDYLFSILPYVEKRIFFEDTLKEKIFLDEARGDIIRSRLEYIMNACFKLPNPSENPEDDQERIVYLNEFRLRMDALEEPVELKQIWESIKAKYQ